MYLCILSVSMHNIDYKNIYSIFCVYVITLLQYMHMVLAYLEKFSEYFNHILRIIIKCVHYFYRYNTHFRDVYRISG